MTPFSKRPKMTFVNNQFDDKRHHPKIIVFCFLLVAVGVAVFAAINS